MRQSGDPSMLDKGNIPVLIVDDDESICKYLTDLFALRGYNPTAVTRGEAALKLLSKGEPFSLVLLDVMMPGINGLEVLKQIKQIDSNLPVIIVSVLGQTSTVVSAIKGGASDYIVKPFEDEELELVIQNVLEKRSLIEEVRSLKRKLHRTREEERFLVLNEKMIKIREMIKHVSQTDVTVLILGESGVGKELVSQGIHQHSTRNDKPFVKINCATLPETLLESELFGYEKGAFTGAYKRKLGKFELADKGTIFLDEIGDISPSLQAKLLQVLQDGQFSRLGGKNDVQVDVRVLVATNQDLEKAVKEGQFREDLYYRLNVVRIMIPPLRERRDEIPMFIAHFLKFFSKRHGKKVRKLSDELMDLFMVYHWPGNVRELENSIQRLMVLGDETPIIQELSSVEAEDVPFIDEDKGEIDVSDEAISLKMVARKASEDIERKAILAALAHTNWNRKKAASLLKISYKGLLYKIHRLGLSR
jgi:DNA-binding NtrC family response regulator